MKARHRSAGRPARLQRLAHGAHQALVVRAVVERAHAQAAAGGQRS